MTILYPSMLKWETSGTAVPVVGQMTHDAFTDTYSILQSTYIQHTSKYRESCITFIESIDFDLL